MRILVINPGSTSTKMAVFDDESPVLVRNIVHSPEQLAQFQEAQDQLSGALSRLLVSIERYPDLKANENFMALQAQLEGTENRITVERQKFNEKAMEYNQYIRKFPRNIIAGMFDFEKVGYFKAQAGAETAPKVEF